MLNFGNYVNTNRPNVVFCTQENGPDRESVWYKTMWLQCGNKMMSGRPVQIDQQEAMDIIDTYPGEWIEGDYVVDMELFQGHEDVALVDFVAQFGQPIV